MNRKSIISLILYSVLIGLVVGLVVSGYNFVLHEAIVWQGMIRRFIGINGWYIALFLLLMVFFGWIMTKLHQFCPYGKGGGIPYAEGAIRGILPFYYIKCGIVIFIGSVVSIFSGLPLGGEGPSIFLGAATARGTSDIAKARPAEKRILMTSGAASGLAVAFNSPCAGIVFALEEVHHKFTPLLFLSAIISVTTSVFVRMWLLGTGYIFDGFNILNVPLSNTMYLVICGIVCGFAAKIFNELLLLVKKYVKKAKGKEVWLNIGIFIISGVLLIFYTEVSGDGKDFVILMSTLKPTITALIVIFLVRFAYTAVIGGVGITGGLFIPMLSIGAILGGILTSVLNNFGLNPAFTQTIIIAVMVAFFSSSVDAPLSAIILSVELTGQFDGLMTSIIVIGVAYGVTLFLKNRPIYEALLKQLKSDKPSKIFEIEVTLSKSAFCIGNLVRDVLLPSGAFISSIIRGGKKMVPEADVVLLANDTVCVTAETERESEITELVNELLM